MFIVPIKLVTAASVQLVSFSFEDAQCIFPFLFSFELLNSLLSQLVRVFTLTFTLLLRFDGNNDSLLAVEAWDLFVEAGKLLADFLSKLVDRFAHLRASRVHHSLFHVCPIELHPVAEHAMRYSCVKSPVNSFGAAGLLQGRNMVR